MKLIVKYFILFIVLLNILEAQKVTWMSVGSLHSWYSSQGSEIEEGRIKRQQDGLQWPAIYSWQDNEAAKGFWVGFKDYDYGAGTIAPLVAHVGPRVNGIRESFPTTFKMVSKYPATEVFVDGNLSEGKSVEIDEVDPTLKADRMIVNTINTVTGIQVTRKILQFSQQYHDNYIIYDVTLKNTGNTDADAEIEVPNKTLSGVYAFWQFRYAVCADTRFVIGQNPTGWGINTMNDTRGDGANPASTFFPGNKNNDVRAQFSWHGKFPPFTLYDNIGGPIWTPYYDKTDTIGRLGAAQFIGNATIFAQKSPTENLDDINQPSTMSYEGSDDAQMSNNDYQNPVKNSADYVVMTRGRVSPRHADKIGATGDPSGGQFSVSSSGGQSNSTGFGPYTLKFGDSVRIIMVEAASGLSREACVEIGRAYRNAGGSNSLLIPYNGVSKTKNDWVYTGFDSLFQTFRRAIANYKSGYSIPLPPTQPKNFEVNSGANKIYLKWLMFSDNDPTIKGFNIYRAIGRYDSTYRLLTSLPPSARNFIDSTAAMNVAHYYFISSYGDAADNNNTLLNPAGVLGSSRYWTQTYDPVYRRQGASLTLNKDQIRIVPNPYNISAASGSLRYSGEDDKITFQNIPGLCTIRIFSELGELIQTINHIDGTGTQDWKQETSSKQIIVSGVYIAVIETPEGDRTLKKFVVIR